MEVTWDTVLFLPGMNAGKNTKAAVCRSVQKRHIAVLVLLSAVPLSTLVLVCVARGKNACELAFPPNTSLLHLAMKHLWCQDPRQPNQLLAVHCQDLCCKVF